jgi:hypothetical protein
MYEAKGNLKWIGETQTFPSGFTKREFVVTTQHDKYPQDLKFEVVKDKCPLLDGYDVGTAVTVSFDIRGNEYNGKYYVNLSCWKLEGGGGGSRSDEYSQESPVSSEPSAADLRKEDDFDDDQIPF